MKLDESAIVLRPRTVPEIVDLSLRVVFSIGARIYGKLFAVVMLPAFAGLLALRYAGDLAWGWIWILAVVWCALAQGVFTIAAGRFLLGDTCRVRDVLRTYFHRFFAYAFTLLAFACVLAATGLVFFLPLPFAAVAFLFMHEASLLEMAGPVAAHQRSARFIRGRGGAVALLALLLLGARLSGIVVGELLGDAIVDDVLQLGQPLGSLWKHGGTPFSLLGYFAVIPILATARFLQYIDIRTRSDAWDVQVKFMAIARAEIEGDGPASIGRRAA